MPRALAGVCGGGSGSKAVTAGPRPHIPGMWVPPAPHPPLAPPHGCGTSGHSFLASWLAWPVKVLLQSRGRPEQPCDQPLPQGPLPSSLGLGLPRRNGRVDTWVCRQTKQKLFSDLTGAGSLWWREGGGGGGAHVEGGGGPGPGGSGGSRCEHPISCTPGPEAEPAVTGHCQCPRVTCEQMPRTWARRGDLRRQTLRQGPMQAPGKERVPP